MVVRVQGHAVHHHFLAQTPLTSHTAACAGARNLRQRCLAGGEAGLGHHGVTVLSDDNVAAAGGRAGGSAAAAVFAIIGRGGLGHGMEGVQGGRFRGRCGVPTCTHTHTQTHRCMKVCSASELCRGKKI